MSLRRNSSPGLPRARHIARVVPAVGPVASDDPDRSGTSTLVIG